MIKNDISQKTENFAGENFSSENYFYNLFEGVPFTFNRKKERLKDVKNIIKKIEQNNEVNSSKHVDILLGNYELFINIGKYVDKIDKNITHTISAQKKYSNLISNLRKDIEEFSFSFSKYLKTMKEEENQSPGLLDNNIDNIKNVYKFEPVDDLELMEDNFDFEDFLNPGEGSDKWLSEHIEKLKMLIDEKKYDACINLILTLRKKDLSKLDYSNTIILDDAYNELIEKLTLSLGKCSTIKEVQYYLDRMKLLGCESLAVDTFLSWLSRKLRNRTQKKIVGEDDYDFISDDKKNENNLSLSLSKSFKKKSLMISKSTKTKKDNLNEIKEEDEENAIKEEEEEEIINKPEDVVDKNEIDTNEIINLINNKDHNMDKTIIIIIGDYFDYLARSLEIMSTYFNIKNKNKIYSTYIIPWLRQEIFSMNKQLENLFGKIRTINELSSILDFISELFSKMDSLSMSAKFIYDMYFIKNLNISLVSIINYCLKVNITGVPFELKNYNINFNSNVMSLLCVSELSPSVYNISLLMAEFINKYSKMKNKFIGIIFLEENLFDFILNKEFFPFIKNKIVKNISNNYDLMPFTDNNESMAPSNQTLINYGITILSLEIFFKKIVSNPLTKKELNKTTIESIDFFILQFDEEKKNYFENLLKVKTESHFFKFFENQSSIYSKNSSNINEVSKFTGPDRGFLSFFQLMKNIAKMVKTKTKNNKENANYYIEYFIIDSIYNNFLKVIRCLKNLNEIYETDFNLGKMGTNGLEHVIYGVYYVYFCVKIILGLDKNDKYLNHTRNFLDELISEWSQARNIPCDIFIQNKLNYEKNVQQYINSTKSQLAKGYQ